MRKITQICCAAVVLSLGNSGFGNRLNAAEFGENTPYYEDDGWLDITEWFDGNDYNPTDEAWWRWDDEVYEATEDVSGDADNDNWYGFTARDENDWYYDYYDPYAYGYYDYDRNNQYEYGSRYYDYDKDGFYDAYAFYTDLDGDGVYEDFDYYTFTDTRTGQQKQARTGQQQQQAQAGQKQQARTGQQQQQQQQQEQAGTSTSRQEMAKASAKESRQQTVSGQIQKTKLVQVRGGQKHVVVAIQPQQGQTDQTLVADLGSANKLKNVNPKLGDKITVKGPKAQVGKQTVLLAKSFDLNGRTIQVDRGQREITGKVVNTKKAKIRGQEHLIAVIETSGQQGKTQKVAVDLGRADRLKMNIKEGSTLTFSGLPVKVKDTRLMMAQSVKTGDQVVQVNRQPTAVGGAESQEDSQQEQGSQEQGASSSDKSSQSNTTGQSGQQRSR